MSVLRKNSTPLCNCWDRWPEEGRYFSQLLFIVLERVIHHVSVEHQRIQVRPCSFSRDHPTRDSPIAQGHPPWSSVRDISTEVGQWQGPSLDVGWTENVEETNDVAALRTCVCGCELSDSRTQAADRWCAVMGDRGEDM